VATPRFKLRCLTGAMRLEGSDGQWVQLTPDGYQFPELPRVSYNGWDENWLFIAGQANFDSSPPWSFRKASLTVPEATQISSWFRRASAGDIKFSTPDEDGWRAPDLSFTEPTFAFGIDSRDDDSIDLLVYFHFSLESASPKIGDHPLMELWPRFGRLTMHPTALEVAADTWERELAPYPARS